MLRYCQSASLRLFEDFFCLLVEPFLFVSLRLDDHAVRLGVMILIEIREGGEAVGGNLTRLAAAVHLGVDSQGGASSCYDFAFISYYISCENRELEVDAMEHQKHCVFGVNILSHSEIRALQEIFRTAACEKCLMMVQVGEFYQTL